MRDAVVIGVLVAGGVCSLLVWHPLGRWAALVSALVAVLAAAAVYRAKPSAFPWRDDDRPGATRGSDAAHEPARVAED